MEHQHTPKSPPATPEPSDTGPFMGNTAPRQKEFEEAVAKGYEPHDLGLRMVFIFIGGLTVTLVVVLAFVYAVMMAMANYHRSESSVVSPVKVELPAPYAPLQPSLGFYDRHDLDHDVLDAQDMLVIRERTASVLGDSGVEGQKISGTTPDGRKFVDIHTAMDTVVANSLLVYKPAIAATTQPTDRSALTQHEGVGDVLPASDKPGVHTNNMQDLNYPGHW